mmetsp:Transcript_10760/g.34332  ORF Transcript_10760/g.34332 Transcript_10760/m.34332 type:complete len:223 (+) Transcript_10760:1014-1682(+)
MTLVNLRAAKTPPAAAVPTAASAASRFSSPRSAVAPAPSDENVALTASSVVSRATLARSLMPSSRRSCRSRSDLASALDRAARYAASDSRRSSCSSSAVSLRIFSRAASCAARRSSSPSLSASSSLPASACVSCASDALYCARWSMCWRCTPRVCSASTRCAWRASRVACASAARYSFCVVRSAACFFCSSAFLYWRSLLPLADRSSSATASTGAGSKAPLL